MVTRNWKAIVSIGGTVAASLPSSAKRATQELERLSGAQRIDQREARKLGGEIKTLRKGTQDYKTALAQQASVKTRLAERSVRIRELGDRAQQTGGILSRFRGGLASIGPAGAAGAAGVGLITAAGFGLVRMINAQSAKTIGLTRLATVSGLESTEIIERSSSALRTVTADADAAFAQVANVLSAAQKARLAAEGKGPGFSDISLGASFSGVSVESIQSGDIRRIVEDLEKSVQAGLGKDQIVIGLEMQGLDRETIASLGELATNGDAASRAWENFNTKKLLTPEQRRQAMEWNDTVGDIKENFGEAQRDFTGAAAPGIKTAAEGLTGVDAGLLGKAFGLGLIGVSARGGVLDKDQMAAAAEILGLDTRRRQETTLSREERSALFQASGGFDAIRNRPAQAQPAMQGATGRAAAANLEAAAKSAANVGLRTWRPADQLL